MGLPLLDDRVAFCLGEGDHSSRRSLPRVTEAKTIRASALKKPPAASIVRQLAARIESSGIFSETARSMQPPVTTGWSEIDALLTPGSATGVARVGGGLQRGAIHEWLGVGEMMCEDEPANMAPQTRSGAPKPYWGGRGRWSPPLGLLIHLAWHALEQSGGAADSCDDEIDGGTSGGDGGVIVWIGRRIWPYPIALARFRNPSLPWRVEDPPWREGLGVKMFARDDVRDAHRKSEISDLKSQISNLKLSSVSSAPSVASFAIDRRLLERSIFIDPPDDATRLWAIDLALRSQGVRALIADGRGLSMAASRRLQLAAERSQALALLTRPSWEEGTLSAAATRWRVRRAASTSAAPRWTVELVRCKAAGTSGCLAPAAGMGSSSATIGGWGPRRWELELDHAKGCVRVVADVADRPDPQAQPERASATLIPVRRSA